MTTRRMLATAAGLWAATIAGCGEARPRTVAVRGQITYHAQPLAGGTVTFVPFEPGPAAIGVISKHGRFTLTTFRPGDGALPGEYRVMIVAMAEMKGLLPEDLGASSLLLIPYRYANHLTSGLTAQVIDGDNNVTIDLERDRPDDKPKSP